MSLTKKLVCLIVVCAMLIPALAVAGQAAAPSADRIFALRMEYIKENVFPQGWYWKGGDLDSATRSPSGGGYNVVNRATECHAFALHLAEMLWGSYPLLSLSEYRNGATDGGWTCYTRSALGTDGLSEVGLQPGDIVRASYGSYYGSGHTAVVWKVKGDTVYFAEAWGSYSCKINWGGFNYYAYSLSAICARYRQVAIWRYVEPEEPAKTEEEDLSLASELIRSREIPLAAAATIPGVGDNRTLTKQ